MPDDQIAPARAARQMRLMRPIYFVLGLICVGLGIIGAFLPLMPSTIFLILAAWCFARSSERLEAWLMGHRTFGPVLRAWRDERAIPRRAKVLACAGMTLGLILFYLGARPEPWLLGVVALALAGCAAYVVSRPDARRR